MKSLPKEKIAVEMARKYYMKVQEQNRESEERLENLMVWLCVESGGHKAQWHTGPGDFCEYCGFEM